MNRSPRLFVLLGLLTIGYCAQLFSPLRMNTDATCYLEMAASASDGIGFICCKNAEHYPIGYPAILALLDRARVGCSASIIGLNLAALTAGLVASASLFRRSFAWTTPAILLAVMATLLNWALIKHTTLPVTDSLYFGLSLVCLAILTDASAREYPEKLPSLSVGLILVALAVAVRTIGIALIPAFALATLSTSSLTHWVETIRKNKLVASSVALTVGLVGLLCFLIIARTNYFREMIKYQVGLVDLAVLRLDDWGELVLNLSMAKIPSWLRSLQLIAGALGAILILQGFARRRRFQVVDVYMAGYMAILFVWPYRDARFWIPVFPLILGYVGTSARPLLDSHRFRWMAPTYLVVYSLMGVVALGYSSWLTFSGDKFGDRFAGGVYRDSYRVAFGSGRTSLSEQSNVDPQIVRLLKRYQIDRPSVAPGSVVSSTPAESR